MENTTLLQLWKNLQKRERLQLRKWLLSPYHNVRTDILELFDLLNAAPEAELGLLTKHTIFEKLFPGAPYDNDVLNHLFSFLTKQIESFLTYEEITKNEPDWHQLFLARALRRRQIPGAFERKIAVLEQTHAEKPQRNADWHLIRYQIQREKLAQQSLQSHTKSPDLGTVTEALTHFFLLENIHLNATGLSFKSLYGSESKVPLSEEVLAMAAGFAERDFQNLKNSGNQNAVPSPATLALEIVRLSFQAQNDPADEGSFQKLKTLLPENEHLFNAAEWHDLYRSAINFALRRHNRGERPGYTQEALDLYRTSLEKGFLFESGKLPKAAYNNINRLACLLGERDFAAVFLEKYRDALPVADRENVYRFNRAIFHYLSGEDFQQVPKLLQSFDFTDVYMNLHAREMLLRSYFELEEWQSLASLCDSFSTYLRRKKDLGYHRKTFLNLIKFIRQAMKPGAMQGKKAKKLAAKIRSAEYVAGREWLLGKLGME